MQEPCTSNYSSRRQEDCQTSRRRTSIGQSTTFSKEKNDISILIKIICIKLKRIFAYLIFIGSLLSISILFIDNQFLLVIQLSIGIPGLFILRFIDINELKNAFIKKGSI